MERDSAEFEIQLEQTRSEILKKLGEGYGEDVSRRIQIHLNNFDLRLYPEDSPFNNLRKMLSSSKETSIREVQEGSPYQHSERFLNMTIGEFFEDIDWSMRAEGVDAYELDRLCEEYTPESKRIIAEKVFPVYVRLRALGYNAADLTT